MQPFRRHIAPQSFPEISFLSRNTTSEHLQPIADTSHTITNNAASALSTPKLSVAVQELLALLDKINVEMTNEIARVTAAISEVEDSVKLLRFDRVKAACVRDAMCFPVPQDVDEDRNIMQIL